MAKKSTIKKVSTPMAWRVGILIILIHMSDTMYGGDWHSGDNNHHTACLVMCHRLLGLFFSSFEGVLEP